MESVLVFFSLWTLFGGRKLILVKRRTLDIWVYYVNYRCCLLLCCMEERVDASIYNGRVYSSFYTILQLFEGLN